MKVYKMIFLMDGGYAPSEEAIKKIIKRAFPEEDANRLVKAFAGPQWADPQALAKAMDRNTYVCCLYKTGDEWQYKLLRDPDHLQNLKKVLKEFTSDESNSWKIFMDVFV